MLEIGHVLAKDIEVHDPARFWVQRRVEHHLVLVLLLTLHDQSLVQADIAEEAQIVDKPSRRMLEVHSLRVVRNAAQVHSLQMGISQCSCIRSLELLVALQKIQVMVEVLDHVVRACASVSTCNLAALASHRRTRLLRCVQHGARAHVGATEPHQSLVGTLIAIVCAVRQAIDRSLLGVPTCACLANVC